MNIRSLYKTVIVAFIGVLLLWGTSSVANAQKQDDKKDQKPPEKVKPAKQAPLAKAPPNPVRQQVYVKQQTENQKRYDTRSQTYQQGQQQRAAQKPPLQQQITPNQTGRKLPPVQKPFQQPREIKPLQTGNARIVPVQNNGMAFKQRRVDQRERQQINVQQSNWHRSEQNWQNSYNSRLRDQQSLYDQRQRQLRQQNRRQHGAFQQAYWERVREDRMRLQSWQFFTDVGLNYGYNRGGHYYYTSEYGMNMLRDAINDGYQQGLMAGQSDREDSWQYDYQNAFEYQDASYGYNGYWVGLDEYQYYFRQGFQRGYEDGFNDRYEYGQDNGGNYSMLDITLNGILEFSIIGD